MLSISNEYELSLSENSNQLIKGTIRFADKTTRELTGDDIVSCSFDQQVSSEGSFDVGTAIIGQMNITLNNHDGRFDACDFTDSKFRVWVGKELSTGTEWIQRGLYTANQPDAYNGTIAISALDTLSRFEVPFSEFVKATGLPLNDSVQIRQVIGLMCRYRGVQWDDDGSKALDKSFVFAYVDQSATCRQVLAYCCQVCCVNASATYNGHLKTSWYDTSVFESEDDCDGGVFDSDSPYSTGASKDGGDFLDYSSGDSIDGGTFITNRSVHQLYAFSSVTVNTDDVVITGVRVSERNVTENNETINGETVQVGEDGYVLSIGNNPLILPGFGRDVADTIANKVIGMRFRPFSGKHICVPSIEAGDCAYVIDRKQNMHRSYVTRVKYTVNGGMTVSCGAKSASRNSADNAGASTSAYVKARNEMQRELSARDLAIKSIGESLANAKGMYHTEVKQEDGSIVYYLHDKPTTDQSKIIYKISADGIGISTDSGKTYATGLTADGDAILKRIYALGINADYIDSGSINAQKVSIANLLSIGDGTNSVKVSTDGISFNTNGQEAMRIKPVDYKMTCVSEIGANGQTIFGVGGNIDTDAHDDLIRDIVCNEPMKAVGMVNNGMLVFKYKFLIRLCHGGKYYTVSSDMLDGNALAPLQLIYASGDAGVTVMLLNPDDNILGIKLILKPTKASGTSGEFSRSVNVTMRLIIPKRIFSLWVDGVDFYYATDSIGGEIVQANGINFLDSSNFATSVVENPPFTGQVRIPFAYNNAIRDYVLSFEKGLLIDWKFYTPTDAEFRGY